MEHLKTIPPGTSFEQDYGFAHDSISYNYSYADLNKDGVLVGMVT